MFISTETIIIIYATAVLFSVFMLFMHACECMYNMTLSKNDHCCCYIGQQQCKAKVFYTVNKRKLCNLHVIPELNKYDDEPVEFEDFHCYPARDVAARIRITRSLY